MILPFDYRAPKTLQEACTLLYEFSGKARIIAGGTDLVPALRNGDLRTSCLVDLTRIAELRKIDEKNGMISIGAAATHYELISSKLLRTYGKILSDAASQIGSPQIRNLGTIGGNIVNASPAADTVPPLMVLDAIGRVVSKEGERHVPLAQLFKGPYETSLNPYEILCEVSFRKLSSDLRYRFLRLARREAMAIARMSVAIVLQMDRGESRIEDARISVGAVTPIPHRFSGAEAILKGRPPNEELLQSASRKVSEDILRWGGVRSSTSYKVPVVEALFVRAFKEALEGEA